LRAEAATLRLAVFPRAGLLTAAMLVVAGTGLVAACAQISVKLPFTPVPIGQTFAFVPGDVFKLYLAGALLPTAWRVIERLSDRS
jgi:biotin transporter BioY